MFSSASRTSSRHVLVAVRSLSTETPSSSSSATPPPNLHAHPPPPKPNPPGVSRSRTLFHPTPRASNAGSSASKRAAPSFLPYLSPSFGRNQMLKVPDATRTLLERIVGDFQAPVRYAFAYGSGVFEQAGYESAGADGKRPMVDFIFAVTHADHWHSINMQQNPSHYPLHARMLGSSFVSRVQEVSPGLWFNPMVTVQGTTIKYGVTTVDALCSDLLNWRTLYLAGRMHKPIRIIKDDPRVRLTQQVNLVSAARASLLALPSTFSKTELFRQIAGLSYGGDPRMVLPAENRGKVDNIVARQAPQFEELYHRLVGGLPGVHWRAGADTLEQDDSPKARAAHLRKLPATLLKAVEASYAGKEGIPAKEADEVAYWQAIAGDARLSEVMTTETNRIVRGPATMQALKGIVSSGPLKSLSYSAQKIGKWWKGSSKPSA